MPLDAVPNDSIKSIQNNQADYIFSKTANNLITLIDTTQVLQVDNDLDEFPLQETVKKLEELYLQEENLPEVFMGDTFSWPIKLKDGREYQLSLTSEGYISLERDGKVYMLEFAKPNLQLPWYASAYKVCAPGSFNKKLEQILIKNGIDDPFIRQCIVQGMSLHNVQKIDIEKGMLVRKSPDNIFHYIEVGKSVLIDLISEIISQSNANHKKGKETVTLELTHFSTLIAYIDKTYPNYDIKSILSEHLENIVVKVPTKFSK